MSSNDDFTENHYIEILLEAQSRYRFVRFTDIPWGDNFVLWRHDVDISLNRALRVAQIESELGISSTFLINLHSIFYNVLEKGQTEIVRSILDMGHAIGLHIDTNFHEILNENDLTHALNQEKLILESITQSPIEVFSFHNPTERDLQWSKPTYLGLVNCYAKILMSKVAYCSDSNGYWRHERLIEFLNSDKHEQVHVLTHPEYWLVDGRPPRERIFRAAYGRASWAMKTNDLALRSFERQNMTEMPDELRALLMASSDRFDYVDYLWNTERMRALLHELVYDYERLLMTKRSELHLQQAFDMKVLKLRGAKDLLTASPGVDDEYDRSLVIQCRAIAQLLLSDYESK